MSVFIVNVFFEADEQGWMEASTKFILVTYFLSLRSARFSPTHFKYLLTVRLISIVFYT